MFTWKVVAVMHSRCYDYFFLINVITWHNWRCYSSTYWNIDTGAPCPTLLYQCSHWSVHLQFSCRSTDFPKLPTVCSYRDDCIYQLTDREQTYLELDGYCTLFAFMLTIPSLLPVCLFWSISSSDARQMTSRRSLQDKSLHDSMSFVLQVLWGKSSLYRDQNNTRFDFTL